MADLSSDRRSDIQEQENARYMYVYRTRLHSPSYVIRYMYRLSMYNISTSSRSSHHHRHHHLDEKLTIKDWTEDDEQGSSQRHTRSRDLTGADYKTVIP